MTNPNPSVPDPNAYPASSPQQPSYLYQGGVPSQGIQQQEMPQNWAAQPGNEAAAQGYAQAGNAGYGYDGSREASRVVQAGGHFVWNRGTARRLSLPRLVRH